MTIPANLTHAEIGAYLVMIGRAVMAQDVAAEVVVDLASYSDPGVALSNLSAQMYVASGCQTGSQRAHEIIENLTLVEAVTFNSFDGSHLAYDCVNDTWRRVTP